MTIFLFLEDEHMSKKLDIEHQPDIVYNYCTLINPDRYPKVADIYTQELLAL